MKKLDFYEKIKDNYTRPTILNDYLEYLKSIRGLSPLTIKEYGYDLDNFILFIFYRKNGIEEEYDNKKIDKNFFNSIDNSDLYSYVSFLDNDINDNSSTRSRKISSIKTFFNYMYTDIEILDKNISEKLKKPKIHKKNPVYLTLSDVRKLLDSILLEENLFLRKRDYAIIYLFLTTGMRLSELAGVNLDDVLNTDHFTITGKGSKQRVVYINKSCIKIINDYITERNKYLNKEKNSALFISTRKKRMSKRSIQYTIDKYLKKAGFDTSIYSTHKLRHTAATLMYRYGDVDIRTLQVILGHESLATTQIYTHVENEDVKEAINKNPIEKIL